MHLICRKNITSKIIFKSFIKNVQTFFLYFIPNVHLYMYDVHFRLQHVLEQLNNVHFSTFLCWVNSDYHNYVYMIHQNSCFLFGIYLLLGPCWMIPYWAVFAAEELQENRRSLKTQTEIVILWYPLHLLLFHLWCLFAITLITMSIRIQQLGTLLEIYNIISLIRFKMQK